MEGEAVTSILNTRSFLWIAFFSAILVAWLVLFMMVIDMDIDLIGRPSAMGLVIESLDPRMPMYVPMANFGPLFAMWAIMMVAMMLPTLVPTLRSYEDLIASADGSRVGWLGVLLGYFVVWLIFAGVITSVQLVLLYGGVVNMLGTIYSYWAAAGLLVIVGLFQFTNAKEICHGVCYAPMMYFFGHWKTGFRGGLRMGMGLGAFCVGCCWGFMVLGFVGGVMNLVWMGLATLFMILEKLPSVGGMVKKPMGVALILAGVSLPVWVSL